jgi:Bacterial PH domain
MFKKMAAEALGISDIGAVITHDNFDKVDSDDYLFHEEGEKIYFIIKSRKDEYCFTNLAFIHVDGESAISAKRAVKRYEWAYASVSGVSIETAGKMDLDIELKFVLNERLFSIDIGKQYGEQLKDIYKALTTVGRINHTVHNQRENAYRCLDTLGNMHKLNTVGSDAELSSRYTSLVQTVNQTISTFTKRDFGDVFETYIRA